MSDPQTAEHQRLADHEARRADWKDWGPYVAERAWGTVREDYSPAGTPWEYFPFEHARSRAYRWNEDGLGGFCNRYQNLCLGVALWNERDPCLKERLFGLDNHQGNHGEDVKEYYFYLDNTPTHSYAKMVYKYPQVEFPYQRLIAENGRRSREQGEWELIDALGETFEQGRYFDVFIEYAKVSEQDLLCRITAMNRGPDAAPLHILPHVWYRNTWSWGYGDPRPVIRQIGPGVAQTQDRHLGARFWYASDGASPGELLFTDNDTNFQRLFGTPNATGYVKDGIDECVVHGRRDAVNPEHQGTKAAAHFRSLVGPGESYAVWVRFAPQACPNAFGDAEQTIVRRQAEADSFYSSLARRDLSDDERLVQRQAFAGLLWTKQFYHYSVELWLAGDPATPPPPDPRVHARNHAWPHLYCVDVLSMPDKWEYPWFAAWDLAFHTLPIAMIDPEWAKRQLILLLREWYMNPNGQIPAYEWNFSDVNPPVHAWAAWRVYKIARNATGAPDTDFLEEVFHKLLLNFTWWVNRKDQEGDNVFEGGFLGLDNIGIFDRSQPPHGADRIEQADGTAWMGMFCLNMMAIALELARTHNAYEAIATKFFEHFIYIANAIDAKADDVGLWNETDGFYYDRLRLSGGGSQTLPIRSFVGLIPLFAVETIEPELLDALPHFRRRMEWFLKYRPELVANIPSLVEPGRGGRRLLAMTGRDRLERILPRIADPAQFLSPYGLRSLSREHLEHPFRLECDGQVHTVDYEPGESTSGMFGGNSNWRGPVWFPLNYLLVESLQKFHHYYGESFQTEFPAGTGQQRSLGRIAHELSVRMTRLFLRDERGRRAVFGDCELFQHDAHWRDCIPLYEYFHGDTGKGLGASHQTGWTALVAKLLEQCGGGSSKGEEGHQRPLRK